MIEILLIGFFTGVGSTALTVSFSLFLATFLLSFFVYFYSKKLSIFLLGLCVGMLRVFMISPIDVTNLNQHINEKISCVGVVSDAPSYTETSGSIVLKLSECEGKPIAGKIIARTFLYPKVSYADKVSVEGILKLPKKILNVDTGREFDYPNYLLKDKITHIISNSKIEIVSSDKNFRGMFFGIKDKLVSSLEVALPEPHAGLASGILLGTKTVSKSVVDSYRLSGVSHIVVLSGYNITIVADTISSIVKSFAPSFALPYSFGSGVVGIIFFVLAVGGGASAIRAGIMSVIALLAIRFGRKYDTARALLFSATLMVLWNPLTLVYDPSFHLSFLATLGVIFGQPIVLKKLSRVTERYGLREILATTIATQIFVLPYILYMSGTISIFGILGHDKRTARDPANGST